jgi:hypothetical protein
MNYIISKILSLRLFPSSASSSSASSLPLSSHATLIQSAITKTTKNVEENHTNQHLTPEENTLEQQEEQNPSPTYKEWTKSVRDINGEILIGSLFSSYFCFDWLEPIKEIQ